MGNDVARHFGWLLAAVSAGAARHDSFEIERHFDVSPVQAVELGAVLHDIACGPRAVVTVERIVVHYRAADGSENTVTAASTADGRLGMPEL